MRDDLKSIQSDISELVEYCMDNNKTLPDWTIISDNTVGAENINKFFNNFKKHTI